MSMGFWISATSQDEVSLLSVAVWETNLGKTKAVVYPFRAPTKHYVTSIAIADKLRENTQYHYEVRLNGEAQLCGLDSEAFTFHTLSASPDNLEILLMSCHGIEAYQQDPKTDDKDTWNMWDRVLQALQQRPNCRIGLLGGDQVYMDDTFGEDISKFNPKKPDEAQVKAFEAYRKYWGEPVYRRVLARLPCLLMWDDHDIIDGWGSREEQFGSEKWKIYGEILYRAFDEMQGSRNIGVLNEKNGYSFLFKSGSCAVLGLDLRNTRRRKTLTEFEMLSDAAKTDIKNAISGLTTDIETLFILSPVTIARMGGKVEFFLGALSNFMWELMKWFGYGKTFLRMLSWTLIFAACYFALYLETPSWRGSIQSTGSLLLLSVLTLGNWKNFPKYFPRAGSYLRGGLCLVLLGLAWHIQSVWFEPEFHGWSLLAEKWLERTSPIEDVPKNLWSWIRSCPIDTAIGLFFSIGAIGFFGFVKSKTIQKKIVKCFNLKKEGASQLVKIELGAGILFFILPLLVLNWWRGLPGNETSLTIFPYAIFGLLTFLTFIIAILESMGLINMIAGLNDDVLDSWSAEEHQDDLRWLLEQIELGASEGRQVHILCGDIHTGGLSTISFPTKNGSLKVSQITSSPISYVTMPPLVEKLTSGIGEVDLIDRKKKDPDNIICSVNNVFFRSNRNFVILKTKKSSKHLTVDYYFEDLSDIVSFNIGQV